jgi:hypothetical protein
VCPLTLTLSRVRREEEGGQASVEPALGLLEPSQEVASGELLLLPITYNVQLSSMDSPAQC